MSQQYINQISLVGRLGQDPEPRYFETGAMVCNLSLAVKPPYKSEEPHWWNIEAWGKLAETLSNWAKKGSLIAIEGEVKIDCWIDKDGQPCSKPVIKVNSLNLLSSSKKEEF